MFNASSDLTAPPAPKPLGRDRASLASDEHGRPVPYLAGRRRLGLTWISDAWGVHSKKIKRKVGKKQETVGHTYYASFAGVVCLGPVKTLHGLYVEEEEVWTGPLEAGTDDFTEITVEGRGTVTLYWGTPTQDVDPTLAASGVPHPAYRGQCYAVFDDWSLGENRSQVPAVEFDVTRLPETTLTVGAALNGEAHPLAALEELLTSRRFGAGLDPSLIDAPSWNSAAAQLASEGFSLSVFLDQSTSLDALIGSFLEYLDAALVQSPSGALQLRLLRQTSVPAIFTTEHLAEPPSLTAHGWPETVNEVVVRFTNRARNWQTDAVTFRDAAAYNAAGRTVSPLVECDWITDPAVAWKVAAGLARSKSLPWMDGQLAVRRDVAEALRPGDTVTLTYPTQGIEGVLFRVLGVELPAPEDSTVTLTVREDTAHLLTGEYLVPPDDATELERYEPQDCHDVLLFELPYSWTRSNDPRVLVLPARGDRISNGFTVWWERAAESYAKLSTGTIFGLRGTLNAVLSATGEVYDDVGLDVTLTSEDDELDDVPYYETVDTKRFLIFVGSEIMLGWSPVLTAAKRYRVGLIRGQFGTRKGNHAIGDEAWLVQFGADEALTLATFSDRWSTDSTTRFKIQPFLLSHELPLADATEQTHTFNRRALRPLTVANLSANGDGHCPTYSTGQDVTFTWTQTDEDRNATDPTIDLTSRADSTVLEFYDGETLLKSLTVSKAGPYTLSNDNLVAYLGSEITFNVRAFAYLGRHRSLDFDSITVTKV